MGKQWLLYSITHHAFIVYMYINVGLLGIIDQLEQ